MTNAIPIFTSLVKNFLVVIVLCLFGFHLFGDGCFLSVFECYDECVGVYFSYFGEVLLCLCVGCCFGAEVFVPSVFGDVCDGCEVSESS